MMTNSANTTASSRNSSTNSLTSLNNDINTSWLTRSKIFQRFTMRAFELTADEERKVVYRNDLYAAILVIHLNLAKYAGAAACYPPTRQKVHELFDAADDDNSGYIDKEEFKQIVVICCVGITSRIVAYYAILIFMVPYITAGLLAACSGLDGIMGWGLQTILSVPFQFVPSFVESIFSKHEMAEKAVGFALFILVIPFLFEYIDQSSKTVARNTVACAVAASPSSGSKSE